MSNDETRLSDDVTRLAGTSKPSTMSFTSSSSGIDHGRFEPGAVVDGRYRIVALLGRGGMGEVYRADDLRLGQPVALKFLPVGLSRDPARLAQFHNEVRTARQVSHPNVCRMHDIGEVEGHPYLTMEYVDGEDLATSLRRIGRFPEDRALEIARQIAAGLAAAHERGIIHRDLKPANIMLDGAGKVRLMDFGLASLDGADHTRAGTPAYMAPEQLRGQPASARSDIFALGLVLYELFTGRRAFTATTVDALVAQQEASEIRSPSSIVTSLDPVVERAIVRCLDRDPARRPATALMVAASLPGGDPLAMALAAGETPSPEVVAAAGGGAEVAPSARAGAIALALVVVSLIVAAALADRYTLVGRLPLSITPRTLADRARQFEEKIGAGANARDRAFGIQPNADVQAWINGLDDPEARRGAILASRPSPLLVWYRSSPRLLAPTDDTQRRPSAGNPPLTVTGMTVVAVDLKGRLMEYAAVPPQVESLATPSAPVQWNTFFEAAGLDPPAFTPVTPDWTPRSYADMRLAWQGTAADLPGVTLRVEAASHRGVPVNFQIIGPWARPVRMQAPPVDRATQLVSVIATVVVFPMFILAGVLLARRNLRLGRGDRRGALTLVGILFAVSMAQWIVGASHYSDLDVEQTRLAAAAGRALLNALVVGLLYLAIEPEVRRWWPQMLITWTRLLTGTIRDPLFGRDLVAGTIAGLLMTIVTFGHYALPGLLGWAPFRPAGSAWDALVGASGFSENVLSSLNASLANAMVGGVGLVLARRITANKNAAFVLISLVFAFLAARGQIETGRVWLDLLIGFGLVAIVLFAIVRWGFVAGMVGFFVHFMTKDIPLTLDPNRLYIDATLSAGLLVLGLAAMGVYLSRLNAPSHAAVYGP